MPINSATEMAIYKSQTVNDTTSNGGGLSTTKSINNTVNNMFPNIFRAERVAGSTKYRKFFAKVESASQLTLYNTKLYLSKQTTADDLVTLFVGTESQRQSDITADGINDSETHYGCADLNADVSAAATTMDVAVENASLVTIFRNGDLVRISDKTDVNDAVNNEEFVTLTSVSSVGNVFTLGFTPALANGYLTADNTKVSSVLPTGDIENSVDNVVVTSASGIFDYINTPIQLYQNSTVDDTFTVTFTSATTYTVDSATYGNLGAGSIGSDFSPVNPDFASPYFTLPIAIWQGTFANADTVVFDTLSSTRAFWLKRIIPANTPEVTGNTFRVVVDGESI